MREQCVDLVRHTTIYILNEMKLNKKKKELYLVSVLGMIYSISHAFKFPEKKHEIKLLIGA